MEETKPKSKTSRKITARMVNRGFIISFPIAFFLFIMFMVIYIAAKPVPTWTNKLSCFIYSRSFQNFLIKLLFYWFSNYFI